MIQELKAFLMRGDVLTLAVAVIIGAAFNKIVTSLVDDVIMPIMGGLELAVELRVARRALRILFISGYTDDLFLASPELREGTVFLQKPFTPKSLLENVRTALASTVPTEPEP